MSNSNLAKHDWRNVTINGNLKVRCDRCKEIYSIQFTGSKVYCQTKPSK